MKKPSATTNFSSLFPPEFRAWNPLAADAGAARDSSYLGFTGSGLQHCLDRAREVSAAEHEMHAAITGKVDSDAFPCVAAKSAFNRQRARFGLYPALGSARAVRTACHDLYEFSHEFADVGDQFTTFVAAFDGPPIASEVHFEQLLWRHLQSMNEIDAEFFPWYEDVSSDPDDARFSFSLGGRGYFVVGMHPLASRQARRTALPVLVFNLHEQFERLRERGKFDPLKTAIRARDMAAQGTPNPMLDNFGDRSETRQYSGRAVPAAWRCPFHAAGQ
jgi:FPC/CPF motif-containing protein YcgG